jgi:uncharacterized protein
VRIEVGYGLEGTLTDASSTGHHHQRGGGVSRGVDDIMTVVTTDASEWQQRPSLRLDDHQTTDPMTWLLIAGLILLATLLIVSGSSS